MFVIKGDIITITTKDGVEKKVSLGSPEGFNALSKLWLRAGWDTKYVYSFTWMGRPIIQLPEDILRIQEVIYSIKPDVIIETGVAHGGSLVFYASLCKTMEKGRVIGVELELRPHNRKAITEHFLSPYITLIDGSSTEPAVIDEVKNLINPNEKVMVLLDSNHTKAHVLAELDAYAPFVSKDSYIVAMDGIMQQVAGAPRTTPEWTWNNPLEAAKEFTAANQSFVIDEPAFLFNEGTVNERVTYWPCGFIKRVD